MTQTSETTRPLSPRETKARELLEIIIGMNDLGTLPTKMDVIIAASGYHLPNRTRAGQYRIIDRLVAGGLVRNVGEGNPSARGYRLQVTAAGRGEPLRGLRAALGMPERGTEVTQ